MGYDSIPYEKRIKENIRNYSLSNLYNMEIVKKYFYNLSKMLEINVLLTDRHGEKEMAIGDGFLGYHPDVVAEPGRKLRIRNHTIGHLYIRELSENKDKQLIDEMMDSTMALLEKLGEEVYLRREDSIYLEELEKELEDKRHKISQNEKEDVLTGVYNKIYFEEKMKLIDRSEVIPVGVVDVNINDWKYANDHFGDDGSDRLIKIVADILKETSKPDYIIGRTDGDVFGVLIPIAEDGEAEEFAAKVQERCNTFNDEELAPSVAVGVVYKTNIEETLEDRLSDAEYEMFNNKFEVKNAPGYRERLEKAIRK